MQSHVKENALDHVKSDGEGDEEYLFIKLAKDPKLLADAIGDNVHHHVEAIGDNPYTVAIVVALIAAGLMRLSFLY